MPEKKSWLLKSNVLQIGNKFFKNKIFLTITDVIVIFYFTTSLELSII